MLASLGLLALSLGIWWSPGILVPDTYWNLGDILFPLVPARFLEVATATWNPYASLGQPNWWPAFVPSAFVVWALSAVGVPLWVTNRLWVILPTAALGWGTCYLFKSLFPGRYANLAGALAGTFAMLAPYQTAIPIWYIAWAGVGVTLGSLIRGLDGWGARARYAVVLGVGTVLTAPNPRFLYLTIFAAALILGVRLTVRRKTLTRENLGFLATALALSLAFNAFWIAPFLAFQTSGSAKATVFANPAVGGAMRLNLLQAYGEWANPLWVLRLFTSNPHHPMLAYLDHPLVLPFSLLIPLYAFAAVVVVTRHRVSAVTVAAVAVVFALFATVTHYQWFGSVYFALWQHFPGFWILNHSMFWLMVLTLFYAVLVGATTQGLLERLGRRGEGRAFNVRQAAVLGCILLLVGVPGTGVVVGVGPKETVWGRLIYPTHLPPFAVAATYAEVFRHIRAQARPGDRLLNVPWTIGGYAVYRWWPRYSLPDLAGFLSPVPVLGLAAAPERAIEGSVLNALEAGEGEAAARLLARLGVRYILVHRDYVGIPHVFEQPEARTREYELVLSQSPSFIRVIENEDLVLYELRWPRRTPPVAVVPVGGPGPVNGIDAQAGTCIVQVDVERSRLRQAVSLAVWFVPREVIRPQGLLTRWTGGDPTLDAFGLLIDGGRLFFAVGAGGRPYIPELGHLQKDILQSAGGIYDKARGRVIGFLNDEMTMFGKARGELPDPDMPLLIGSTGGLHPRAFFDGLVVGFQVYAEALALDEMQDLLKRGPTAEPLAGREPLVWWSAQHGNVTPRCRSREEPAAASTDFPVQKAIGPISLGTTAMWPGKVHRLHPTRWEVTTQAVGPFALVFNEAFHPGWEAYVVPEPSGWRSAIGRSALLSWAVERGQRQQLVPHEVVGGYVNGWRLERSQQVKSHRIVLEFWPQRMLEAGLIVSSAAIVGAGSMLLRHRRRE